MVKEKKIFLKDSISLISKNLANDPKYIKFAKCGPLEINKYSLTFWLNFSGENGLSSVYAKIPALIDKKKPNYDYLINDSAKFLAFNEYKSLKFLSKNWTKKFNVSFIKPVFFIKNKNIIITERAKGKFLFKELRKNAILRNKFSKNALSNFGKSLSYFHKLSSEETSFETKFVFRKFYQYTDDLKKFSVSEEKINFIEDFKEKNELYKSSSQRVNNLKGIDVRQILYRKDKSYVMDPGKMFKGYCETDLARFILTLRIINWGRFISIFKIIFGLKNKKNEEVFLNGYFDLNKFNQKNLSFMITKEILKHWIMAHKSLDEKNIPIFIKSFIKKFYIDLFFFRLFSKETLLLDSKKKTIS